MSILIIFETSLISFWLVLEVTMAERDFQRELIAEIKRRFPGAFVMKNDPSYIQGVPDLTVLIGDQWFELEVKDSLKAKYRPNQPYYIRLLNEMSYAARVTPENMEDVLNEIQSALKPGRASRIPRSK